jgi:hypothetical protein
MTRQTNPIPRWSNISTTCPTMLASATSAPAARPAPRKQPRAQVATPFMDRMGDILQAHVDERRLGERTMCAPEMVSGVATCRAIEVTRAMNT